MLQGSVVSHCQPCQARCISMPSNVGRYLTKNVLPDIINTSVRKTAFSVHVIGTTLTQWIIMFAGKRLPSEWDEQLTCCNTRCSDWAGMPAMSVSSGILRCSWLLFCVRNLFTLNTFQSYQQLDNNGGTTVFQPTIISNIKMLCVASIASCNDEVNRYVR